jgi:hypothetical protein
MNVNTTDRDNTFEDFNDEAHGAPRDSPLGKGVVGSGPMGAADNVAADAPQGDVGIGGDDLVGQPRSDRGVGTEGEMNALGGNAFGAPKSGRGGMAGPGESITDVDKGVGDGAVSMGGDVGNTSQTGGLPGPRG